MKKPRIFRLNLLDIHPSLSKIATFKRQWLEKKLKRVLNGQYFSYFKFKPYSSPNQKHLRSIPRSELIEEKFRLNNADIVFLAGGTCRIPFIQKWHKKLLRKAQIIMDGELEIITATGAAVHALQVLSGEVEPYIKIIEKDIDPNRLDGPNDPIKYLYQIATQAQSPDLQEQMLAVTQVRELLSSDRHPLIDDLAESGILHILVEFLHNSK